LVIVENGSTDVTPDILAAFDDPRINVFAVAHTGRTEALNIGLAKARGKYVAVLDADDVAMETRLAMGVEYMGAHPQTALVASWVEHIDGDASVLARPVFPTDGAEIKTGFAYANPITHSSAMYPRKLAMEVGGYPEQYVYAQDFALYQELALKGEVAMIPEVLVQLRMHGSSATESSDYHFPRIMDALRLHALAATRFGATGDVLHRSNAVRRDLETQAGFAQFDSGHRFSGLSWLTRGFFHGPVSFLRHAMVQQRLIAPVPGLLSAVRGIGRLLGVHKAK
ncbi:MAG: glycosyltransferase, partial [Sphingomonadales bacterium]|nr:glycosyltransferase [Sphingomonadales bacterium]